MATIVCDDDVLGGEPRIVGSRVGVLDVYELVVDGGYEPADVADQFDRSIGEIYTALAYYHDHPDEMRRVRRDRETTEETLAKEALRPPERAR